MKTNRLKLLFPIFLALVLSTGCGSKSNNEEEKGDGGQDSTIAQISSKAQEIREQVEAKAREEAERLEKEMQRIAKERQDSMDQARADSLEVARLDSIKKRDEFEWKNATRRNTIASYTRYIRMFPTGSYILPANTKIIQLKRAEELRRAELAKKRDKDAWNRAVNQNTVRGYQTYLRYYPRGIYQYTARNYITKMQRKVRVTVQKLVCEMSDDEGPGNDADMDRFKVKVTAYQTACSGGKNKQISQGDALLYDYSGSAFQVQNGSTTHVNKSATFTFDSKNCQYPRFVVSFYAREQDGSSADEETTGTYEVTGGRYGNMSFTISTSDFRYRCYFNVASVN